MFCCGAGFPFRGPPAGGSYMTFTAFINAIKIIIETLPPLFVATVLACLVILTVLAIKRIIF